MLASSANSRQVTSTTKDRGTARHQHGAEQVRVQLGAQLGLGILAQETRESDTGVADHHIRRPQRRLGGVEEGVDRAGVPHVEDRAESAAAGALHVLDHLLQALRAACAQTHGEAARAERPRRSGPDPRRGSGDEGGLERGVAHSVEASGNSMGRAAKPRTLTECTLAMPSGWIS